MPDSLTSRLYAETRTINASAEVVYAALTDFAAYSQWNPWIVAVQGVPSLSHHCGTSLATALVP